MRVASLPKMVKPKQASIVRRCKGGSRAQRLAGFGVSPYVPYGYVLSSTLLSVMGGAGSEHCVESRARILMPLRSLLVLPETVSQLPKRHGPVILKAFFVHVNEVIHHVRLHPVDVLAPLSQSPHLERHVQIFPPLGFDDENPRGGQLDQEVGVVVGDVAVRFHVVQLEMHCQVVLGVGDHIVTVLQEASECQLKTAVPDDAVEDALLRDYVALFLGHEWARLPKLDGVAHFG